MILLGLRAGVSGLNEFFFSVDPLRTSTSNLLEAIDNVGRSWCGSWIGSQATIYLADFAQPTPRDVFDREWGGTGHGAHLDQTRGAWVYVQSGDVTSEIYRRSGVDNLSEFEDAAFAARDVFEQAHNELLPTLDAVHAIHPDETLRELRNQLSELPDHFSQKEILQPQMPQTYLTRDSRSAFEGIRAPYHLEFKSYLMQQLSYGTQVGELAKIARRTATYLEMKHKMKGKTVAKTDGKILVGHGRSPAWLELAAFIRDRLRLDYEEFNRETPAGLSNKERLLTMLDSSCFAFLVMTAEDDQADGSTRARQNVIHEAGLFQGRYGFERAIVMLEEGCEPFSNIEGIGQIRFPKGNIKAAFEEVRQVLEQEKII